MNYQQYRGTGSTKSRQMTERGENSDLQSIRLNTYEGDSGPLIDDVETMSAPHL